MTLHRDKQVAQCVLKLLPVLKRVEKFDHKGLNLDAVQVLELAHKCRSQVFTDEVLVRCSCVRHPLVRVQSLLLAHDGRSLLDDT